MREVLARNLDAAARLAQSKRFHVLLGLAASLAFSYLIARSIALQDVKDAFRNLPVSAALVAAIPLAAAILLRAYRWRVLFVDENVRFSNILITQNTGLGINNLSPVRMLSEPVQFALITRRYKAPFSTAFTTLVGGNVLDIFTTALLMAAGVLLTPDLRDGRVSIQLLGAFTLFIVSALVFVAVARGLQCIPFAGRFRFFEQVIAAVAVLKARPGRLWAAFAATVAHWLALGIAGWIVAGSLGVEQHPFAMVSVLVAATFFTSAVPSAPAGIGAYHFAVMTMLVSLGADPASAFSFAVVMHLMVILPPTLTAAAMAAHLGLGMLLPGNEPAAAPVLRPAPPDASPSAQEA